MRPPGWRQPGNIGRSVALAGLLLMPVLQLLVALHALVV